jgi:hypothetical protein
VTPVEATPAGEGVAGSSPGAELVLAPRPDVTAARAGQPTVGDAAAEAGRRSDAAARGTAERADEAEPLPLLGFPELHALWDDEVTIDPDAGSSVGKEVALVGPAPLPAALPGDSTELAPFRPEPPDFLWFEARAIEAAAGSAGDAGTASTAPSTEIVLAGGSGTAAVATGDGASPDTPAADTVAADIAAGGGSGPAGLVLNSPPTMPLALPGTPGARARKAAARRGARRRRNLTILVAVLVALVATLVPVALSSSGGSVQPTAAAGGTVTPQAPTPTAAASPTPTAAVVLPVSPPATTPPAPPGNQPGVPGLFLQSVPGGVTVTVIAPFNGGPVTSYTVTSTPGGIHTLAKPGIFQVSVDACGEVTVMAQASGPGGNSEPSAPMKAIGCVPPGPPSGILSVPDGHGHLVVNWNVPDDVGGTGVNLSYVVTVYRTGQSGVTSDSYTIFGHSYTRDAPSAADPYFRITVAAKNDAGVGAAAVAWGQ